MFKEHLVELRTEYLVRGFPFGFPAVLKIKADTFAAAGRNDLSAVLDQKPAAINFLFYAHPFERVGAGGQHRFTHPKPGKPLLFQDHDFASGLGQKRSRGTSCRTSADDCNVEHRVEYRSQESEY